MMLDGNLVHSIDIMEAAADMPPISLFAIEGTHLTTYAFKMGHINETFVSEWSCHDKEIRYIHQKVNHNVFLNVPALMANVERVTIHIRSCVPDDKRVTLKLVPLKAGGFYIQNSAGEFWRTYEYIEGAQSYEVCRSAPVAFEAARVVGEFLKYTQSLSPGDFIETIPGFHFFPGRFKQLDEAIKKDAVRRVKACRKVIEFALSRQEIAGVIARSLENGEIPLRVTHNDLKLNNVMFDAVTKKGLCVVDLDTVMPGSALFDFGDLVRSVSISAREDETDLQKVILNKEYFSELVRGFFIGSKDLLTPQEIDLMHLAPRLLALALGVRFLTDYLNGDHYFKVNHANHNLERARCQFKVVEEFEKYENELKSIVNTMCQHRA